MSTRFKFEFNVLAITDSAKVQEKLTSVVHVERVEKQPVVIDVQLQARDPRTGRPTDPKLVSRTLYVQRVRYEDGSGHNWLIEGVTSAGEKFDGFIAINGRNEVPGWLGYL